MSLGALEATVVSTAMPTVVATLGGLVHYLVDVPHEQTPRIQEVHAMIVHVLCQVIEEAVPA